MIKNVVPFLLLLASCGANIDTNVQAEVGTETDLVYSEYEAVDREADQSENDESYYTPFKKGELEKFRIAVMQSGEYFSYADVFEGILQGLNTIGWIADIPMLQVGFTGYDAYEDGKSVENILTELSKSEYSDYIEISMRDFFDLSWSDDNVSDPQFSHVTSPDAGIDLIIALGTQISSILSAPDQFHTPVLVDSISDPVGSNILASETDSGKSYLTGVVDPEQDLRQVKLFHSVIKFQTLGIIFEDSELGRAYGAVDDITAVASELGFDVVANTNVLPDPEDEDDDAAWEAAEAQYVRALDELAPTVDAVYLGIQAGLSEYSLADIVDVLNKHKVPSFVMEGKNFVRDGVLLGESDSNLVSKGIYNAKKIVNILKGRTPRELDQIFEHVPHIAINLDTAGLIGYDVPIDIIASADDVFVESSVQ